MLRFLFDKNVPYPLRKELARHEVRTAEEEGCGQVSNGELITRAEEAGFAVLVTCDQNVSYQQNLARRTIAMVVLGSNSWPRVQTRLAEITRAIDHALPRSFEFIEITPVKKRRTFKYLT